MTQKAVLLKEKATSLVFSDDHHIPQPSQLQLQIKVAVAGLNGHDQKIRDMGIFLGSIGLPAVLANDVVGKVVAVGSDVTTFKKGDRVVSQADFVSGTPQNGLQEYAVLNEQFTARIPDSITDDEAATLPTSIIASLVALFHDLPIPAPWTKDASDFDYAAKTLLIVGGGSVAGRYAVQLAKLAKIGRIVVVGGNEENSKNMGRPTSSTVMAAALQPDPDVGGGKRGSRTTGVVGGKGVDDDGVLPTLDGSLQQPALLTARPQRRVLSLDLVSFAQKCIDCSHHGHNGIRQPVSLYKNVVN
ncbi:hypothetical protein PRZ48_000009 [Zasmidium cellare]|uniref:Enoyl reductase (ER) domain-containing protein n=1 Tax=Zasmidium cellare TaxID=395010 RepID=A0ABR0EY27_ZASCE|nr:hypothetical protein PRZ48_000009 [Zasmidium cellare]